MMSYSYSVYPVCGATLCMYPPWKPRKGKFHTLMRSDTPSLHNFTLNFTLKNTLFVFRYLSWATAAKTLRDAGELAQYRLNVSGMMAAVAAILEGFLVWSVVYILREHSMAEMLAKELEAHPDR